MSAMQAGWEPCPKCNGEGCPFCGHGYLRTTDAAIAAFLSENRANSAAPSRLSEQQVHWLATVARVARAASGEDGT